MAPATLGKLALMAASTTTSAVSTIPTGDPFLVVLNRRARILITTIVLGIFSRTVIMVITTSSPALPTGVRSPDAFMYYNYTSFYVMEDGSMITYAVEYSYGIF